MSLHDHYCVQYMVGGRGCICGADEAEKAMRADSPSEEAGQQAQPEGRIHMGDVLDCPAQSVVEGSCICKPGWGHRSLRVEPIWNNEPLAQSGSQPATPSRVRCSVCHRVDNVHRSDGMSDDGSHTFISEWTASLSRQGARQEGCGIGTEAFRLAQEWLDGQSESRRSIRDADAEILAMYADHREAALRELDKARVSQLAQAKMDHVQACFRADAAEAQLAAMREVLRKLMKEAQGFLALAAIGDHDLTNIRVLQSEIDDAYAALAAPAGRGENGA